MKILDFFLFLWVIFALLDPDPATQINADPCGQGFGSGSALIWVAKSGSGTRRAKMTHKNRKKYKIFMFWSAGCFLLRVEGFSCSLGVLYGGLWISKLQFLTKEIKIKFPAVNFFNFRSSNPGSGSAIGKNAGSGSVSGSALNQCGSETLVYRH